MASFWDGTDAQVLDESGNPVGSTGTGDGAPPGAWTGDAYGDTSVGEDPNMPRRGSGFSRRTTPVAGAAGGNSYNLQTGTYTGGGQYPLASVMGEGLMQPWTTPFNYGGFSAPPDFKAPTAADMQQDPGYEIRMAEGAKALQRGAASRGTLLTGGTQKDLMSWAQDYASNEYGKVYNRRQGENQQTYARRLGEYQMGYGNAANEYGTAYNIYNANQTNQWNRLNALAGYGTTATNQLNQFRSSYANNQANLAQGMGNVTAAGNAAQANIWGNAATNIGTTGMAGYYSRPTGTGSSYVSNDVNAIDQRLGRLDY
jgi:hypothetical protein